jgi:GH25 family lysozyme M1 (1,4-beta-N-acetylmuramidase)
MDFVPVIDVSHHQKVVDFTKAKANGVAGVIIRANNGDAIDGFLRRHIGDARAAGYDDSDLGFYMFCNPKSTSGKDGAKVFVDAVHDALGHLDTFLMFDAESYNGEPGNLPVITGSAYAAWLAESMDTARALAPQARVVLYTGHQFWKDVVPGNRFVDIDTIIARYPIWPTKILMIADEAVRKQQLKEWIATSPKPPRLATGWAEWILGRVERPPQLTGLGPWSGWQFSAQFNNVGATYGVTNGADLDLNIVHDAAWARWTNTAVKPVVVTVPTIDPIALGPEAVLTTDHFLAREQALTSGNQRFSFIHQADGNVVLYDEHTPLWSSGTEGTATDVLFMQADGNLVLLDPAGEPVWNTKTHRHPGSHLELRDDGHAAVVGLDGQALWTR